MSLPFQVLASTDFLPHGQCLLWDSTLVWLHTLSDSLIALAYYSIPLTLSYFVYKRKDLAFKWIFLLFAVFIVACGTTHLMGIWTLWQPVYWLDGLTKVFTAVVSVITAVLLVPLVPQALALPSPQQLASANAELQREITARREVEKEQERFFTLSSDLFCIAGMDGTFKRLNPAWARTLGYPVEDLMGVPFLNFVHPEDREATVAEIQRLTAGQFAVSFENRFRCMDGTYKPLLWNATPQVAEQLIYATAHDMTASRQVEEQLRQSQKMEAIGQLAGGIAHDFNNMLTVILGYTTLLLSDTDETSPNRQSLEVIETAGKRAANLTNQLLAFSRKQVLKQEILILPDVVKESSTMLQRLIGEAIRLEVHTEETLWKVKVDRSQLEQVILNLVINARDAMPEGGTLTIETANVFLDLAYALEHPDVEAGPYVMLAVTDTGCGMDAQTQAHIFEPFFTTKDPGKGTGLGLSTVYGIVKQSGGHVWVYSEPGRGATFKIYLPRTVEEGEAVPAQAASVGKAPGGTETILLVEDVDAVRMFTRALLERYGYTVIEARDGSEALLFGERFGGPIHLLLTDVVMPGMNGRVLAGRLTRLRPNVKVLYMSGYADKSVVHNGALSRSSAFIQKPFAPVMLARKIREVLDAEPT